VRRLSGLIEAFNDVLSKYGKRPIVRGQTKDED
jgi:hypothetical protein